MRLRMHSFVAFSLLLGLVPAFAGTQSLGQLYVVVSPDQVAGPSAVVAFDVDGRGHLHQAATYETGGAGRTFSSPQSVVVDSARRLLFVANNASDSISVFHLEQDGGLSPVAGSPFPSSPEPTFMALQPGGSLLFVSHPGSIQAYEIGRRGRLIPRDSVSSIAPREIQVDARGRFLFAADMAAGLRAYSISTFGDLTEFAGSPFRLSDALSAGRPFYLRMQRGRRVLLLDVDEGIGVWNVNKRAHVDVVAGSPFPIGEFSGPFAVTTNGAYAYVSVPFEPETYGFKIELDGRLTPLPGSPFEGDYGGVALIVPSRSRRVYEVAQAGAEPGPRINLFAMQLDGSLVKTETFPLSDAEDRFPNGAAYSPKRWDGLISGPDLPDLRP